MKKLAVIGNPVKHSLSPKMHNAALEDLDLSKDYNYSAVELKDESQLYDFCEEARKNYLGFNITFPFKEKIIKYLDVISEQAKLSNSVNTVKVDKGRLYGYTTDGYGLELALKKEFNLKELGKVIFIGCGGAAQGAIVHMLYNNIVQDIIIINRTKSKADSFIERIQPQFPNARIKSIALDDAATIQRNLTDGSIIIQSTNIGLKEGDNSPLDLNLYNKNSLYFDMVYAHETEFIKNSKIIDAQSASGSLMLLYQGAKAFEIWTKIKPNITIMQDKL